MVIFFKKYILFREWCIKDKFIKKIVLWESQKIFVAKIIKQILNKKGIKKQKIEKSSYNVSAADSIETI